MAPLATMPGVTAEAIFRSSAVIRSLMFRRDFERLGGLPGQLLVGLVSKPLRALVRRRVEQCFQIDGGGCAVPLDRLDGDRRAGGNVQLEAHDGLVDAADLLDGKSSIADALAIEQHEL